MPSIVVPSFRRKLLSLQMDSPCNFCLRKPFSEFQSKETTSFHIVNIARFCNLLDVLIIQTLVHPKSAMNT